ncbi:MAG: heat-inducible transcriptional repressor HrcA [Thermodesulfovibrionales bacterium]|nr:heat-inducible transcriptional repressor HrcA [Thermodesulfovibrionales bacterium]
MVKEVLDERSKKVLYSIVESYIRNPEPVGSRYVTRRYALGFSSATIRNIMADLEEIGFLSQPHTSAGRIPTDKGYRFYVDYILELQDLTYDEELEQFFNKLNNRIEQIRQEFNINTIFTETTDAISAFTNYIGVITPPRPQSTTFKRLELIRFKADKVVAILLTNEGVIKNKIIKISPDYTQEDLNKISDYLNREFEGVTLDKIKTILNEKILNEKDQYNSLIVKTIKIYEEALSLLTQDIFISGLYDAINLPDFADISKIKELSNAIREKHLLIRLLNEFADHEGVQVIIGNENPIDELKGLSIVASTYKDKDRNMGVIAVLGPRRMDYSRTIYMIDNVAKLLSKTFD